MFRTLTFFFAATALVGCVDKGSDSGSSGSDGTDGTSADGNDGTGADGTGGTDVTIADLCTDSGDDDGQGRSYCILPAEIDVDVTMTTEFDVYFLAGPTQVGNNTASTLSIDAGVLVEAGEQQSYLEIQQNSMIMAMGTADAPIVLTSGQATPGRGDWGGLVINGNAPINVPGGTGEAEVTLSPYGGTDASDNSGTVQYLRVEFGGYKIDNVQEMNGITLNGVGSGTTISYVQVHQNNDDGIEFFGGTVGADHVVVTGALDDSIDWTEGWSGTLTNFLVVQASDAGDRGIEADNNGDDNALTPIATPTVSKGTILAATALGSQGAVLRAGTHGALADIVITGAGDGCLDIDSDLSIAAAEAGDLTMTHSYLNCNSYFNTDDDGSFNIQAWFEGQTGNSTGVASGLTAWMPDASGPLDGTGSDGGAIGAFEVGDDWTGFTGGTQWIIAPE